MNKDITNLRWQKQDFIRLRFLGRVAAVESTERAIGRYLPGIKSKQSKSQNGPSRGAGSPVSRQKAAILAGMSLGLTKRGLAGSISERNGGAAPARLVSVA